MGVEIPPLNLIGRERENMLKRLIKLFNSETVKVETFRCDTCGKIISNFDIEYLNKKGEGNICPCGVNEFRPSNPTWWEKILIVLKYITRNS